MPGDSQGGRTGFAVYHSGRGSEARAGTLRDFRDGVASLLICCRALDEGMDVPCADCGIFLSKSASARQRIQRTGRLLRRFGGKDMADLYYFYARATIESPVMLDEDRGGRRVSFVRWTGNGFENSRYNDLVARFLSGTDRRKVRSVGDRLYALASQGALTHNWMLDEEVLREGPKGARRLLRPDDRPGPDLEGDARGGRRRVPRRRMTKAGILLIMGA